GGPGELAEITDDPLYRRHWPLLQARDGPWDALAGGGTLMLSEQLSRRLGVGLGDTVRLATPAGEWHPRVVAVYADYGNPRRHVLPDIEKLRRRCPVVPVTRIAARVAPEQVDAVAARLRQDFTLSEE